MNSSFLRPASLFLALGALWLPLQSLEAQTKSRTLKPATAKRSTANRPVAKRSQTRPRLAQAAPARRPMRTVSAAGDSVRLSAGERVILPFANVTKLIVEDDEVARALFEDGKAVLEGVAPGTTLVEVYQTDSTPKVLSVQVSESGIAPSPLPTTPPDLSTNVSPVPNTSPIENSVEDLTPVPSTTDTGGELRPQPNDASISPARSQLSVSLAASPVPNTGGQAQFTITFGNPGINPAQDVKVRFVLDEQVSYVTGSATNGGRYDPVRREVVWDVGTLASGLVNQKATLRVETVERRNLSFNSTATIEDGEGGPVTSAEVRYSTAVTPLLTVFALPDRFLAGRKGPTLVDVRGSEFQSAVDRLNQLGVLRGVAPGRYAPQNATKRAEYAVMTLNGLNLRDLRDITQIKFVLGRPSVVNLQIRDSRDRVLNRLVSNTQLEAGEHTVIWNGRIGDTFAPPGRYSYVCSARDASDPKSEATTLRGSVQVVAQTPLKLNGLPSFVDVKATDWFARHLAVSQAQGLTKGYPDGTFRPREPISRVEATVILVRALGLESLAKEWADKNTGFLDFETIPNYARGAVNVASTVARTSNGRPIMRGTTGNEYQPQKDLRRDQAAVVVQRLIDRETTRRVTVSGAIVPGAIVSINSRPVEADAKGAFNFAFDLNTSVATTILVLDNRQK